MGWDVNVQLDLQTMLWLLGLANMLWFRGGWRVPWRMFAKHHVVTWRMAWGGVGWGGMLLFTWICKPCCGYESDCPQGTVIR